MLKYFLFAIFVLIFSGCGAKKALTSFEKDSFYANSLPYTFKCDIVKDNEVKVMFTATYLNSVNKTYNDLKENFIFSVYISENEKLLQKEEFYKNENFDLTLNGTKYISLKPIELNNSIYKEIPLYNPWAKYFMVDFEQIELSQTNVKANTINVAEGEQLREQIPVAYDLKLKLNHTTLGSCVLSFAKE